MLKIYFYPESDLGSYREFAEEYQNIWNKYGEKFVATLEELTGKKFRETVINAVVGRWTSISHPLCLNGKIPLEKKGPTLLHELGHRILMGTLHKENKNSLTSHKLLFLVHYDACVKVFGEEIANYDREWDSNSTNNPEVYKVAWDWALSLKTFEERQAKFKEIVATGEVK